MKHFDVLIVGGGLAGGSLALALEAMGLNTAVVETLSPRERIQSPAGDRALALARGSIQIFRQLAVWPRVDEHATPITSIHVSDRGHFGKTRLDAEELGVDSFGQVVVARFLETALAELCQEKAIELLCPARVTGLDIQAKWVRITLDQQGSVDQCTARLVVAADGGNSQVRQWVGIGQTVHDYHQSALVGTIKTELPHQGVAFERFTPSGPLAMLPLQRSRCAMIWTRDENDGHRLRALSKSVIEHRLQETFGWRLGHLQVEGNLKSFPLWLIRAQRLFAERVALVGNAAHQLHPVAGQGFNLGLRDVIVLARLLEKQMEQGGDPGAFSVLEKYAKARAPDHNRIIGFSDGLIELFVPSRPPLAMARNLGLMALDHLPPVKRWFARHAMGMAEDSLKH